MIAVFCVKGAVPDALIAAFFAFASGEAGILGLIKHSENKYQQNSMAEENNDNGE